MSQQSSAAAAQKRMLASQDRQNALNAQLQYLSIKNQAYADSLTDQINANVRELAFTQSQANLDSQERLNQLAVQNARFDASVQQMNADIGKSQQQIETQQQLLQANQQAGASELEALGSAFGANGQDINSILQRLSQGGEQGTAIANILDIAASSGGINEALSLLVGNDYTTQEAANLGRSQEIANTRAANANTVATTSRGANAANANSQGIVGDINQSQARANANTLDLDAATSGVVAGEGFNATRASNQASNNIGILSDNSNAFSRKYLSAANLAAIEQGAVLQSDISKAQASQIKTPGFLDLVNVGYQGYNVYKGLK